MKEEEEAEKEVEKGWMKNKKNGGGVKERGIGVG